MRLNAKTASSRWPSSSFLTCGNKEKSLGAKSGLYGEWPINSSPDSKFNCLSRGVRACIIMMKNDRLFFDFFRISRWLLANKWLCSIQSWLSYVALIPLSTGNVEEQATIFFYRMCFFRDQLLLLLYLGRLERSTQLIFVLIWDKLLQGTSHFIDIYLVVFELQYCVLKNLIFAGEGYMTPWKFIYFFIITEEVTPRI